MPPKTNPSDFFLDTITVDARTPELLEKSKARIEQFHAAYQEIEAKMPVISKQSEAPAIGRTAWPSTWMGEFVTLFGRNMVNNFRDKTIIGAAFGQAIFVAFLISLLYWKVTNDPAGIQNRLGVFFFLSINLTFGVVMPSITVFPEQKRLIKRERAAGSYRPFSAFLAKWCSNTPTLLLSNLLVATIVYFTVGFHVTAHQFFFFWLIFIAHALCANGLGLAIGAAVPNATVGQIVTPLIIIIFMLFGGLLLNLDQVPNFLKWIQWTSLISYTYKAMAQNEFNSDLKFSCVVGKPCFADGSDVINIYGLNTPGMWACVFINFGFALFYLLLGGLIFARTSRPLMRLK